MDTLLGPRKLSQTESSDSETDSDVIKKSAEVDKSDLIPLPQKLIVCPTAKYLQTNPKKFSSFDLLVHPPKRRRIQTPSPVNTNNNNNSDEDASVLNPTEKLDKKVPVESVPFENEISDPVCMDSPKLVQKQKITVVNPIKIFVNSAAHKAIRDSANVSPPQRNPATRQSQKLKQKQEVQEQEINDNIPVLEGGKSANENEDDPEDDVDNENWHEFPCSENYIYYINYSHKVRSVVTPSKFNSIFKTINEKDDVNRNYLANIVSKTKGTSVQNTVTANQLLTVSHSCPVRDLKRPVYRLKGIISRAAPINGELNLRENTDKNVISALNIPCKIFSGQNAPACKKRKVNAPGEFLEEDKVFRKKETRLIYKICNEKTNEIETVTAETEMFSRRGSSLQETKRGFDMGVLPIYTNIKTPLESESESIQLSPERPKQDSYNNPSYEKDFDDELRQIFERIETNIDQKQFSSTGDCKFIREGPLAAFTHYYDETRDSSDATSEVLEDDMLASMSSLPVNHRSPFTVFVQDSPLGFGNAGYVFPFINLDDEESDIKIEDVTEKYNALERMKDIETETIKPAPDPVVSRQASTYCAVMDYILNYDYEDDASNIEATDHIDTAENETKFNEALLKPKPQLTYSSSLHSLRKDSVRCPTLDQFLEKRRKSDFFVGKLAGLSKSIMKLYKNKHTKTKKFSSKKADNENQMDLPIAENNNLTVRSEDDEEWSDASTKISSTIIPSSRSSIREALYTCYKKLSSHTRIANNVSQEIKSTMEAESGIDTGLRRSDDNTPCQSFFTNNNNVLTEATSRVLIKQFKNNENGLHAENSQRLSKLSCLDNGNNSREIETVQKLGKFSNENAAGVGPASSSSLLKRIVKLFTRANKKEKKDRIKFDGVSGTMSPYEVSCGLSSNDNNAGESSPPPLNKSCSYNLTRTLVQHTDSKELYKDRRLKFFRELKEFQEDSLNTYIATALDCNKNEPNPEEKLMSEFDNHIVANKRLPLSPQISLLKKQYGVACKETDQSGKLTRRALSASCITTAADVVIVSSLSSKCNTLVPLPSPAVVELIMKHHMNETVTNSNGESSLESNISLKENNEKRIPSSNKINTSNMKNACKPKKGILKNFSI